MIIHGAFHEEMIIMANTDNQILNWGMTVASGPVVPVSGVILVVSGDVMGISGY